eukprot:scaffold48322_cov31-Phaeocystis_antarctica.AAC.1
MAQVSGPSVGPAAAQVHTLLLHLGARFLQVLRSLHVLRLPRLLHGPLRSFRLRLLLPILQQDSLHPCHDSLHPCGQLRCRAYASKPFNFSLLGPVCACKPKTPHILPAAFPALFSPAAHPSKKCSTGYS